jgi:hypothetical protein
MSDAGYSKIKTDPWETYESKLIDSGKVSIYIYIYMMKLYTI